MNTNETAGVKPANDGVPTPMQASLIKAQEGFREALGRINELAARAPELHNWSFSGGGISANLRLLQAHPAIGRRTLVTQTRAMAIVRTVGIGSVTTRGDGAIECMLGGGWTLILHDACAEFVIPLRTAAELEASA